MSTLAPAAHLRGMDPHDPPQTDRTPLDLVKRPDVGDVIATDVGSYTVTWVGRYGREVIVEDTAGRDWHLERADDGHWTRTERAA